MVTRDVLKVFQIALAYGSCNFENFQNMTRAHKSRNALAFMRFPILIWVSQMYQLSFQNFCSKLFLKRYYM